MHTLQRLLLACLFLAAQTNFALAQGVVVVHRYKAPVVSTGRSAVYNGTNARSLVSIPNVAPYNALGDFEFIGSMRALNTTTDSNPLYLDAPVSGGLFLRIFSTFPGSIYLYAPGGDDRIATSTSDVVVKLRHVTSTGVTTYQLWDRATGAQIGTAKTITGATGAFNYANADLVLAANPYGGRYTQVKYDWFAWKSSVASLSSTMPTTPDSSWDLGRWLFDDDTGTDASGHGLNFTQTNVTYEAEP